MCIYLCLSVYTNFSSTLVWCWWKLMVDEGKLFLYVFYNVFFLLLLFFMHFVFHILLGIIIFFFFCYSTSKILVWGFSMHWICQKLSCCCHAMPIRKRFFLVRSSHRKLLNKRHVKNASFHKNKKNQHIHNKRTNQTLMYICK